MRKSQAISNRSSHFKPELDLFVVREQAVYKANRSYKYLLPPVCGWDLKEGVSPPPPPPPADYSNT